ncbi:peptidase [Thraustotheca clavata]|uniref:Peptidase n=1 Tax=Thraustotheca clavata TaxID=74557 RepID=A0A1W0A3Y6_9STRA|nr:peptidase [Thraustotheca clavata]
MRIALIALLAVAIEACTMIAVGKKATVDGSTIVTHNDDAGDDASDLRLVAIEGREYPTDSERAVYKIFGGYPRLVSTDRSPQYYPKQGQNETKPMGFIPQVSRTYSYIQQEYGIINEVQLAIGESTCNSKTNGWPLTIPGGQSLLGIGELTNIAMERCDSARCAIQTMGDLAVKYGFYGEYSGTPEAPGYDSEALGITDRYGEVWIFHIMAGPANNSAIWAGQRVPDDHIAVVANRFTIGAIDLSKPDQFMASDNVFSAAESMGWYTPKVPGKTDDFDFSKAYARELPPGPHIFADGRTWRVYSTFAKSQNFTHDFGYVTVYPRYPFSVRADNPIALSQITTILRDQFQGTEYDLHNGAAAGPFGSPLRYSGFTLGIHGAWINPLSVHRTLYSYAAHIQSNSPVGTLWFGESSPHGTVYIPFSSIQTKLPASFHDLAGKQSEFNPKSAWWAFNFVNNWRTLRYDLISEDVVAFIKKYQDEALALNTVMLEYVSTLNGSTAEMRAFLEASHNRFAEHVVDARWQLAWTLIAKYSDGYVTTGEQPGGMASPGYPGWWLNMTNYVQWQPRQQPVTLASTPSISFMPNLTLFIGILVGFIAHYALHRTRRQGYSSIL